MRSKNQLLTFIYHGYLHQRYTVFNIYGVCVYYSHVMYKYLVDYIVILYLLTEIVCKNTNKRLLQKQGFSDVFSDQKMKNV